jgi:putative endopeptidase
MDLSVNPAKDFYHYATGTWVKNNPVPADKSRWTSFYELADRNMAVAHEILEQASKNTAAPDRSPEKQVGDFYASFLDTKRAEELGLTPISDALGMVDPVKSVDDLFRVLAALHEQGIGGMFGSGVSADAKNSAIYAYDLGQGGLSLPDRNYYLNPEFAEQRKAFKTHLETMFQFLGETIEAAGDHAATVMDIETELAKASRKRDELRDRNKNYNKFTLSDWVTRNPGIPWKTYFTAAHINVSSNAADTNSLATLTYLIAGQPEFFDALEKQLKDRPINDWKAYLRWHILHGSASFLNSEIDAENFAFFGKTLSGQQIQEPRWKRAVRLVDGRLGEALGSIYVKKYFPPEAKARMTELVKNIKVVFKEHVQKLEWMTDATRAKALTKFERFTEKIGYPDKFRDYSAIDIRRDDCLGNVRRCARFETHRELARIGQPVDKAEWHMTPITVNAYFNGSQNEIVFPAGILQPPFFDLTADDAVNYGAIGVVIGHEITHGYDDEGRKMDADGNLQDWWTESDAKAFLERAQKVEDEYNGFEPLPGLHVNGKLTLGENIADLGGVAIAYDALQRALEKDPSQRRKIDNLTPEQRFFISFSQIWKTNVRDAEARRLVTVDPHSPGRFRATGPLVNFQTFFDAFNIHEGDPMWMAPEKRARIW